MEMNWGEASAAFYMISKFFSRLIDFINIISRSCLLRLRFVVQTSIHQLISNIVIQYLKTAAKDTQSSFHNKVCTPNLRQLPLQPSLYS